MDLKASKFEGKQIILRSYNWLLDYFSFHLDCQINSKSKGTSESISIYIKCNKTDYSKEYNS